MNWQENNLDRQWKEALDTWADRMVYRYLKENHAEFRRIHEEQEELAERYPKIADFFREEDEITLSAKEYRAIRDYLHLEDDCENILREYHYYLGQTCAVPCWRSCMETGECFCQKRLNEGR